MHTANKGTVENVEPPDLGEEVGKIADSSQRVEEVVNIAAVVVHGDGDPAGGVVTPAAIDVPATEMLPDLGSAQVLVVGAPTRFDVGSVLALAGVPHAMPMPVLAE